MLISFCLLVFVIIYFASIVLACSAMAVMIGNEMIIAIKDMVEYNRKWLK